MAVDTTKDGRTARTPRLVPVGLAALLVAAVAACSPKPPIGDAKGGIIDWFATTPGQVQDAVTAHCKPYGKAGRIVDTQSDKAGGHAIFVCE